MKSISEELQDAGATVVRSTVKIAVVAGVVVTGIAIFSWWGTKKFKANREKKALLEANRSQTTDITVEDELLLLEQS